MYHKAYGIIETLAPLHVGASAGEETGNLNLIFRDQFTQTGIIPGSSIRGRFRADMREGTNKGKVSWWYGNDTRNSNPGSQDETSEGIVKFEYASVLWLPVFCPGQPVVYVSCPRLLKRYQKLAGLEDHVFQPYTYFGNKAKNRNKLFFNLGFLPLNKEEPKLKLYRPKIEQLEAVTATEDSNPPPDNESEPKKDLTSEHAAIQDEQDNLLVVVDDTEIAMIHDMALYRQSRVALEEGQKKVSGKAFFNVEALPEGTILVFPVALRQRYKDKDIEWDNYVTDAEIANYREVYFGGLESVGFGRCSVVMKLQTQAVQTQKDTQNSAV